MLHSTHDALRWSFLKSQNKTEDRLWQSLLLFIYPMLKYKTVL